MIIGENINLIELKIFEILFRSSKSNILQNQNHLVWNWLKSI